MNKCVIVSGPRDWQDWNLVKNTFKSLGVSAVCHGDEEGLDRIAGALARDEGICEIILPANWHRLGNSAGPRRNNWALTHIKADYVLLFGECKANDLMLEEAERLGVETRWIMR